MNRVLIEEAKILIDSVYIALDSIKDPKDVEVVREMLREADALLARAKNPSAN